MSEQVKPLALTDQDFETVVLNSDRPVVVDFWAPWCGPCRALGPTIDELAEDYGDRVHVAKLNVDENPAQAMRYGIQSIPAVLVFHKGEVVERMVGIHAKSQYAQVVDSALLN